jgi:ABC-type multidrug transport system, permease component
MSPVLRRLTTDIRFSLLMYARSRQAMFFSFVFPVLFLAAVWFLLGNQSAVKDREQVEYLLPGIISTCIVFSAISCTAGSIVKYRAGGTFRKLMTTPLSSYELNASRIISGMIVVLFSSAVSLLVAWLEFGIMPDINVVSVLVILAGSVTFVGMGMVIAYLIDDPESVNAMTYIVVLPLVVLSGSFFPVERLPGLLMFPSILSPLTYLNDGLRDAMFGGSLRDAAFNLGICGFLGFMVFVIGVAILMAKEET